MFASLVLLVGLGTTMVQAQSWRTEFGIQSGFTRIKPAGSGASDHIDLFGVPGFNLPGLVPAGASLFAIFPWKNKIAIEASVSAFQGDAPLVGEATLFDLGIRGNYAITPKVYAAAGARLNWLESGGQHETQLGVQAGIGYRFGFVRGLRGRIEANASFLGKTALLEPFNTYAVEFGVSKQLGAPRARSGAPARRSASAWEPVLGVQGGYSRAHSVGGGDVTALSIPGLGGGATVLGAPAGPPVLFAIFPVGRKLAIEPGLDFNRIQSLGTTIFGANVSARLNYAVSGGWYGAVGGNLVYLKATGGSGETLTGLNLGWGYRFPLLAGLGGRFELDYTMIADNAALGSPPINTLGLQFAATMPLR